MTDLNKNTYVRIKDLEILITVIKRGKELSTCMSLIDREVDAQDCWRDALIDAGIVEGCDLILEAIFTELEKKIL